MGDAAPFWDKAAKCRRTLAHTNDLRARTKLVERIAALEHRASSLRAEEHHAAAHPGPCEFHVGPEGDRWLIGTGKAGGMRIIHRPQGAAGTDTPLATFLVVHGPDSAPHRALTRFLSQVLANRPA